MSTPIRPRRWRFADVVVAPAERRLWRGGREVKLIPRYFDLLVLLLEHRHEAVSRQTIFDTVWHDVVVSDGALTQAVRSLRQALGDDPREPCYVRTAARHGYQFHFPAVVEELGGEEEGGGPSPAAPSGLNRVLAAGLGGAGAGAAAGLLTAVVMAGLLGWHRQAGSVVTLVLLGTVVGGLGALGVGAGLVLAERWTPFGRRGFGLVVGGALGGALVGTLAHQVGRASFSWLVGHDFGTFGGGLEGLVLGAAAGLGLAVAGTGERARAIGATALATTVAALGLAAAGRPLTGASLHLLAGAFPSSAVDLLPLARLVGEQAVGPRTQATFAAFEGVLFGAGLAWGITWVPRKQISSSARSVLTFR